MIRIIALAVLLSRCILAQSPSFDVASVKPTNPNARTPIDLRITGGRLVVTNNTLSDLVRVAFGVAYYQISGGPAWFKTDRFDIEAKAGGEPSHDQMMAMLQTLLADRFQLKFHRETKEGTVRVLTVANGGPKLKPAKDGDPSFIRTYRNTPPELPGVSYTEVGQNASLSQLTATLGGIVQGPVVDQTGIKGNFDFRFDYVTDDASIDEPGAKISDAVRDQLGLKLSAQKGPVEILTIDRAEKPSGN